MFYYVFNYKRYYSFYLKHTQHRTKNRTNRNRPNVRIIGNKVNVITPLLRWHLPWAQKEFMNVWTKTVFIFQPQLVSTIDCDGYNVNNWFTNTIKYDNSPPPWVTSQSRHEGRCNEHRNLKLFLQKFQFFSSHYLFKEKQEPYFTRTSI